MVQMSPDVGIESFGWGVVFPILRKTTWQLKPCLPAVDILKACLFTHDGVYGLKEGSGQQQLMHHR
jgi:hypothetical protein